MKATVIPGSNKRFYDWYIFVLYSSNGLATVKGTAPKKCLLEMSCKLLVPRESITRNER